MSLFKYLKLIIILLCHYQYLIDAPASWSLPVNSWIFTFQNCTTYLALDFVADKKYQIFDIIFDFSHRFYVCQANSFVSACLVWFSFPFSVNSFICTENVPSFAFACLPVTSLKLAGNCEIWPPLLTASFPRWNDNNLFDYRPKRSVRPQLFPLKSGIYLSKSLNISWN